MLPIVEKSISGVAGKGMGEHAVGHKRDGGLRAQKSRVLSILITTTTLDSFVYA
jgi:hypothetical protein